MESGILITTAIQVIVGVLGIILGHGILKNKRVEWIAMYNAEKYDKDQLCKIVGNNIVLLGILIIAYTIIHFLAYDYIKGTSIYTILYMLTLFVIIINIFYKTSKYAKLK